jgi:hypothetical protein
VITGDVFHDDNRSRRADPGEALSGWTLFLDLNRNGVADAGEPSTVTDAAGRYSFLVDKGVYRVVEVMPAGTWVARRGGVANVRARHGRVIERNFVNREVDDLVSARNKRKLLFSERPIVV